MKNLCAIAVIGLFCLSSLSAGANPINIPSPPVEEGVTSVRICFITPAGYFCVDVAVDFKHDIKEDLKIKARLSDAGDSISFWGFPPSFQGQEFQVKEPQFSGFTHEGKKLFIKAGKYKVSEEKATVKVQ